MTHKVFLKRLTQAYGHRQKSMGANRWRPS